MGAILARGFFPSTLMADSWVVKAGGGEGSFRCFFAKSKDSAPRRAYYAVGLLATRASSAASSTCQVQVNSAASSKSTLAGSTARTEDLLAPRSRLLSRSAVSSTSRTWDTQCQVHQK